MKLYKRKNGKSWSMRFIFEGVRVDQSTGFDGKKDAQAYAEAFRTKLRNEGVGLLTKEKIEIPTFKNALDYFYEYIEKRLEDSTVRRYKLATSILGKTFGNQRIDKISANDIENYMTARLNDYALTPKGEIRANKKKLAATTINKELAVLKKFFNVYISKEIIIKNPVCDVEYLKEDPEPGRVLNYEEEYLYLNECSANFRDFATILFDTGLRPDELCALTIRDVDLERQVINIPKGKTKAARRTIPLSQRAYIIIRNRIKTAHGEFVFGGGRDGKQNKRVVKFNGSHYGALERSKIDTENRSGTSGTATLYSCRHTFATRFVESGGDLLTLAKLLGHASLKMVMRYAHPSDAHAAAAIRKMSERHQITTPNSDSLMPTSSTEAQEKMP